MMQPNPPNDRSRRDRLAELLADQVMDDLGADERAELEQLRAVEPSLEPVEFDRAAAAAHVAFLENAAQTLPNDVRQRLSGTAANWSRQSGGRGRGLWGRSGGAGAASGSRVGVIGRIGWLAAAACLGLAAWGWWPRIDAALWPTRAVNAAADRMILAWKPGPDSAGAASSGSIVWSPSLQRGYIKVSGLKANDPTREQYQLWIGDKKQAKPISGGVFDVASASGEVIIAMDPNLKVTDPTMFAVTVEQPGGVMVSDLGRVAMLTPLNAGR